MFLLVGYSRSCNLPKLYWLCDILSSWSLWEGEQLFISSGNDTEFCIEYEMFWKSTLHFNWYICDRFRSQIPWMLSGVLWVMVLSWFFFGVFVKGIRLDILNSTLANLEIFLFEIFSGSVSGHFMKADIQINMWPNRSLLRIRCYSTLWNIRMKNKCIAWHNASAKTHLMSFPMG